jgi:tyrosine-protein phosphatase YwqE
MFGFRRGQARKVARSGKPAPDLAWDLHSHLVPGVDDGVPTVEDALEAIRALHALGYRGSVVTPHVYRGLYPNTRETLEPALASLRTALASAGIDYAIHMAAEYFADEHLIDIAGREPLLSFGERLVLVEYPYSAEPLLWADALTALLRSGYTPVLAHIERYRFVYDNPDLWLERFAQFGVKIQCNIGSLVGQYGPRAFELARRMRDQRLATFWGTDLHRPAQIEKFIRPGLTHLTELGQLNAELAQVQPGS